MLIYWPMFRILINVFFIFFSGCILFSSLGIRPHASLEGGRAKTRIGQTVFEIYIALIKSHSTGDPLYIDSRLMEAWLVRTIAEDFLMIDDEKFYVIKSIIDCDKSIRSFSSVVLNEIILAKKTCSTSTPACALSQDDLDNLSIISGPVLVSSCHLEESGEIIQIDEFRL